MIQRPQTLFFLALIAIALMLLFSDTVFYTVQDDQGNIIEVEYDESKLINGDETTARMNNGLVYVIASSALLALISLLSFKNRKFQASMAAFNFVAIILMIVLMYVYSFQQDVIDAGESSMKFTVLIPLAMMLFNYMALRGVRKDEQLVRSMNRLR
ncbi:MAG: DUF4293 domain-containing protein [Bacteroidia bacterium]